MKSAMLKNLKNSDLDKPIYRIISIERLMEMFECKELIFPQVKVWNDVYENFFIKSRLRDMNGEEFEIDDDLEEYYGQCWSFLNDSDALWRIYSPNKQSVRIKTTLRKITDVINSQNTSIPSSGVGIIEDTFLGKVRYMSRKKIQESIQSKGIVYTDIMPNIVDSLFLKRIEFKHEKEVRIIYYADRDVDSKLKPDSKLIAFNINPFQLIEEIAFDPRGEDSYISAYKNYLVSKFNYPEKKIVKSSLYKFTPFVFDIK